MLHNNHHVTCIIGSDQVQDKQACIMPETVVHLCQ